MGVARRLAEWTQLQSLNTPFKLSPHTVTQRQSQASGTTRLDLGDGDKRSRCIW